MKQVSIIYNKYLNSNLKLLGFKRKGSDGFMREINGVQQTVNFLYSNRNEHDVRYYNIYIGVSYPKVIEIGKRLECFTVGSVGTNIGYLTPEKAYKTWRVADAMSEDGLQNIVNDIYKSIVDFAIPYLDKYSVIRNLIGGMEGGVLNNQIDELYNMPIFYYLAGEKNNALNYMSHRLKTMEQKIVREMSEKTNLYKMHGTQVEVDDRFYRQYKQFCNSFICYMEKENLGINEEGKKT